LREVLQRLARDGWLTIQHGKPTKVNNFWETSGLNILETLARLDEDGIPELVDHLLAARTNLSAVFIRGAIRNNAPKAIEILERYVDIPDDGATFAAKDYQLNHDLAFASGNPVYVLMMNGFRGLYSRIGGYYFSNEKSRTLTQEYYQKLLELAKVGDYEQVPLVIRKYGIESGKIWQELRGDMPKGLAD
jgi:GntR family negative regulator for fad regulon and positive regulator of fabA